MTTALTDQDLQEMESDARAWSADAAPLVDLTLEAIADLRRLRAENERLARENSVILDGQAALKSDLELATERAERADAFSDLVDAVLDADIMSLPDEVRVARLRLLAMGGESPLRKEQP